MPTRSRAPLSSILLAALAHVTGCGGAPPPATPASSGAAPETASASESPAAPDTATPSDSGSLEPEPGAAADSGEPSTGDPPNLSDGETRTMKVIQQIVLDNRARFRACYDTAEEKEPGLQGDLTLYFVLDTAGRVREAKLNEARSTLKHEGVVECVVTELRKLEFPPSSKGLETKVNYPFNFNPK